MNISSFEENFISFPEESKRSNSSNSPNASPLEIDEIFPAKVLLLLLSHDETIVSVKINKHIINTEFRNLVVIVLILVEVVQRPPLA